MKLLCLVSLLLFSGISSAQESRFPVKGEPVRVKNWGSLSLFILGDNYFSATRDSIILQIGEKEFAEMKGNCSVSGWPKGFYVPNLSEAEDKAFYEKLGLLRMYRIAAVTHVYNGKTFDRYVILRVPYSENRDWNPAVTWEGNAYFLLAERDVEPLK